MNKAVNIFADGACRGNPGPGGWGAILRYNDQEKHIYGAELNTTNNKMELTAVINGLKQLKRICPVVITTDSQYVKRGITEWLPQWKKNNWRKKDKKPVKNQELWQELDQLNEKFPIKWHWVKGHSGHPENELADRLANKAIDEIKN